MNDTLPLIVYALVGTILIEWGMLRLLGERRGKVLWASVAMNVLTNLPLNIYITHNGGGWTAIAVGECIVVLVEVLCYRCVVGRWSTAIVYGVLCNAVSFLVGELVQLVCLFFQ